MRVPIFQVDAFSDRLFAGNPAAVCPLERWLETSAMQSIAAENNLSETAFFVPAARLAPTDDEIAYELRWFTPTCEVELCGHATLASAFVAFECLGVTAPRVQFLTREAGVLRVAREGEFLNMQFPLLACRPGEAPQELTQGLRAIPAEVHENASHWVATFREEQEVRELQPDFGVLARLAPRAVIATARGRQADFVSRFFAPGHGIDEDPVTGSAHCTLGPLWAERLGKECLHGRQVSERGGDVYCRVGAESVELRGRCRLYLQGTLSL